MRHDMAVEIMQDAIEPGDSSFDIITTEDSYGNEEILTVRRHPSIETLAAYVDGTLADSECIRVSEHLNYCPQCYALVSETRAVLQMVQSQ